MDHVSEILGAIGVIASLFYVAYQVRQNTHQGKLNTIAIESASSEATNSANNYARLKMAESAELSSIYIRGQKDPQCLIEEEALRFRMFIAVGLSNAQFDCARDHGAAYWLYIVENANEADATRIVRIQDPAGKARTFTFDHGWRSVAEQVGQQVIVAADEDEP